MSSYHKTLNISTGATKGQIKNAYRKLAKKFHPDRNKSTNAHEKFIEISEAYEVLYDGKLAKQKTKASSNKTQTSKEKYWHVYRPPSNEFDRAEWEIIAAERKIYYQEKAKRNAEKRFEKIRKENDAFKKSMLFYPILYCYKLLQIIISIGTLSILILPFSGHYIDPNEYDEVQMEYSSIIILLTILSIIVAIMFIADSIN